jgi:diamine N-acetyltransferase
MPVRTIRPATQADIAWIVSQEQRPDFATFIHRWPPERHERNLVDRDKLYLIAQDEAQERVAFVILAGLSSKARSFELVRMAVTRPGAGIGKPLLMIVMEMAFKKLGASRLWLDVFDDNVRARRVYEAVGFREEGTSGETAVKTDGQLGSLVIMSILATEYQILIGCQ